MEAIQLTVSIPRYVLTKAVGVIYPPIFWGPLAMLRYRDVPEPVLPGPGWVKIKTRYGGICGSDLHTVFLKDSPSLSAFVSSPLTLGHENLGTITEVGEQVRGFAPGDRVVADPLLPCATRGIEEPCEFCRREEFARCRNFAEGELMPGLSIGHCPDTGGSWSPYFVAHQSQLFGVPANVDDENAAMVEPFAGALHWVMRNLPGDARAIVLAKYPFQGEMARRFGADQVIYLREGDYYQALAGATGSRLYKPALGKRVVVGGADVVYECVGSDGSIDDGLRFTRSGGTFVLVGLAAVPRRVDWTPIWLNELTVRGCAWGGTETFHGRRVRTFQLALEWMAQGKLDLSGMVTHRFRLDDYKRALAVTTDKRRHAVIKSVFAFD
jgi:L-iditol 2-dehydrogenase